jgi:hypothetical protein
MKSHPNHHLNSAHFMGHWLGGQLRQLLRWILRYGEMMGISWGKLG